MLRLLTWHVQALEFYKGCVGAWHIEGSLSLGLGSFRK